MNDMEKTGTFYFCNKCKHAWDYMETHCPKCGSSDFGDINEHEYNNLISLQSNTEQEGELLNFISDFIQEYDKSEGSIVTHGLFDRAVQIQSNHIADLDLIPPKQSKGAEEFLQTKGIIVDDVWDLSMIIKQKELVSLLQEYTTQPNLNIRENKSLRELFDKFYAWLDGLTQEESDNHSLTSSCEKFFFEDINFSIPNIRELIEKSNAMNRGITGLKILMAQRNYKDAKLHINLLMDSSNEFIQHLQVIKGGSEGEIDITNTVDHKADCKCDSCFNMKI